MDTSKKYSPKMRERAVRMGQERQHEDTPLWVAMASVSDKIDCTAKTLRRWVWQIEPDTGERPGLAP